MYRKLNAVSQADAIAQAKKMCRCNRASFEGVKWLDPATQVWTEIPWLEVDSTRISQGKIVPKE